MVRRMGCILQAGADLVYPQRCAFCRCVCDPAEPVAGICRQCLALLPLRYSLQTRMAWPRLPAGSAAIGWKPMTGVPPVFCAAYYRGPIREALLRLKFSDAPDLAPALAFLLSQLIRRQQAAFRAVVAVPLHAQRLKERGYNQSELLAACVAEDLGIPCWSGLLCRVRATKRQSTIQDRQERALNVASAFQLSGKQAEFARQAAESDRTLPLLLVDDILTTGATLTAAAEPFRRNGQPVAGLVVASDQFPFGDQALYLGRQNKNRPTGSLQDYFK